LRVALDEQWPASHVSLDETFLDFERYLTMKASKLFGTTWPAVVWILAAMLVVGCNKKNDAVSEAENADKINGVAVPGIEETKQVVQDGFVYGLPIVMYYTSAYELFVDPTSGQFKAPIGKLTQRRVRFTIPTRRGVLIRALRFLKWT
jgi:hypothetical protein